MKKLFKAQAGSNSPSMVVRVFWGDILYDTVVCEAGSPTTVGREPGCTFVMDLGRKTTVTKLPLITVKENKTAELVFDEHMEGHVRTGGKIVTLVKARTQNLATRAEDGLFRLPLQSEDTASVVIGYVSFDIAWAPGRTLLPRPIVLDRKAGVFALAAFATIIVMLTLLNAPVEAPKEEEPERIVEIITPSRPKPVPQPASPEPPAPAAAPVAQAAPQQPQAEPPPPAPVAPPPPTAAEKLRSADLSSLVGNLSSLGNTVAPQVKDQAPAVRSPTSNTSLNTTGLANSAIGQSVSIGSAVAKGVGSFQGAGSLTSSNSSISGGTGGALSNPSGGTGGSGLDKQVIDSIVRKRQDRIRLCYERQLNFVPNLAGKVTVQFVIGTEGQVRKSTIIEDTMNNKAVKECITTEVSQWIFPKPKGNTDVVVDYPFVFESGGG
jgi:outer membrane biosynthesis protein TonB